MQRYRKVSTLFTIWLSSLTVFTNLTNFIRIKELQLTFGHFKEDEFFPEYPIIATELALQTPLSQIFYHVIRRNEKYTFTTNSNISYFSWHILEAFINEFLPEMDTYKLSRIGYQKGAITYHRRGRCLEFVRCRYLKTGRTTWRRDPYPFTLVLKYSPSDKYFVKNTEAYFRAFRLPIVTRKRINRWWLDKKWW